MSQSTAYLPPSIAALIDESLALHHASELGLALQRVQDTLEQAQADGTPQAIETALVRRAGARRQLGEYEASRALTNGVLILTGSNTPVRAGAWLRLGHCAAAPNSLTEAETYCVRASEVEAHAARGIGHCAASRIARVVRIVIVTTADGRPPTATPLWWRRSFRVSPLR
jgi:hypothetical protein